jgi:glycogen debranching enzyme
VTEAADAGVRFLPAILAAVVHATDLGNVVTLKHGNVYLLTDQFGDVQPDSRGLGLYHEDTRILSCATLRINGIRPSLLQTAAGGNYHGTVQLTNPDFFHNPGANHESVVSLMRQSLGIRRDRVLGNDALAEQVRLVNFTAHDEDVVIELGLACDHADIFEVRGYPRPVRGEALPTAVSDERLTFRYRGVDNVLRSTFVALSTPGEIAAADGEGPAEVTVRWSRTVPAGGAVELGWRVWSGEQQAPSKGRARPKAADGFFPEPPAVTGDEGAAAYRAWHASTTGVDSDNELFDAAIARSVADLRLLLNDGPASGERYLAAGVPWFATLFGRDSIITALQLLAFRPQLALDTLEVLASLQATTVDDWHDAEPGKILHEWRNSEMVRAGELPFSPYYGTIDATPLWLVLLCATFDWTGDRGLVDRFWPNALAALEWIDRWGDPDGDGFVEYGRRSSGGLYNQGWKDSGDAIRNRGGAEAAPPIALAEVQGYVFDAKTRMASLAELRGDAALAARLRAEASALREHFERAFWVEDQRFYAMALDGEKRHCDAIASNPGHCLWSGIVAQDRAAAVAERLLAPPMFSGWGLRTYASGQPGFNPIGYHTGTVWPHDTAIAAAGLKRYGLHEEANRLVGAIFEASQHFPDHRLPELFCGFDRASTSAPVPYPVACSPQAWAAGATFQFLQTMLGLSAHAERRELELVRPQLPTWLGRVTLTNVRVGDAAVDLLFHRWRGATSAEVLRKVGDVSVTIRL